MKKIFSLFLLVFLFVNCEDKTVPEDLGDSSVQVIKGNQTYDFHFDSFNSCNKNCDNLYIHINYRKKGAERFSLYFYLKDNGAIDKIWYLGDEGVFTSSYFDPYNHFQITNYSFNNKTGALYFEFEGNLFINTVANREPFFLKGKVDIPALNGIECRNYFTNLLTLQNENTRLLFNRGGSAIENLNTPQKKFCYEFFTDNGFRFTLNSEKNINELPLGEYSFTTKNAINNIMLREFAGKPDISPTLHDKDWIEYETSGSYTITGQLKKDGYDVTVGDINIKAFRNKELKYNFEKIHFEAVNIE